MYSYETFLDRMEKSLDQLKCVGLALSWIYYISDGDYHI